MMKYSVLLIALVASLASALLGNAQQVWVLSVDQEIGPGTVSYLRSGLADAAQSDARLVVLVLATPGGYVDSAVSARDLLLGAQLPTVAYVNREALSAGALLALACDEIVFAPGGVMGAATPFLFDERGLVEEAPEKVQSALRTLFRATAEARGRDPGIAEAMVDAGSDVPGLVETGKLLTLTADEAAAWGYSEGEFLSVSDLLVSRGLEASEVIEYQRRTIDRLIETLTLPIVATFLLVVGLAGLIVEMVVPGFGVAGIVGFLCLGAFFWAHVLVGLAGWESIALLIGGVFAVVLEIFVFTASDFGFAGIVGLVLIGLGFYTSMVGPFTDRGAALRAIGIVSAGLIVAVAVAVALIARLPKTRLRLGGVILSSAITGRAFDKERRIEEPADWIGRRGVAATDLHPIGAGSFDGERIDIVCEEGYLPAGTPIVVVKDETYRKVVRKAKEA